MPHFGGVHELVRSRAEQVPDAVAVAEAEGVTTYRTLMTGAERAARHLLGLGVSGRPVAVRMSPGARQVAASLGVLQAGAWLTWFGVGDPGGRDRDVLARLSPACLLVDGRCGTDPLARWYRDEQRGQVMDGAELGLPGNGAGPPAAASGPRGPGETAGATAYVAFTSGSTGAPKGVAQSHGAFAQFVLWLADEFRLGVGSRVAQWVAPEHDPSLCEVFAALVTGATLCPVPGRVRLHPQRLVDWLACERITFFQTVPSMVRELLDVASSGQQARRLSGLRQLVVMGEAFPATLANRLSATLPWVRVANIYGPTETIAATWHTLTGHPVTGVVPIGLPIPGRQVFVLDDYEQPCPVGVTGQIVVCGPPVAAGYVGSDGDDAFRPVAGLAAAVRCYRTGDLGRWRTDGLLEFCGRRDLQVKLGGTRVEISEVEAALASHESVLECAVVPRSGEDGLVTHLVAYVVTRRTPSGGAAGGPAQWRAYLRGRFGSQLRLVSFHHLSHPLPRNVAGKVDRRRLPDPATTMTK
ncbi:MAG TPA: amino acid adenylation domain-containing protein [Streptosporangiaceae bacterium]|nr:amino acid adenylation domain-containing protein [Streptosporangiaceae bacterium]